MPSKSRTQIYLLIFLILALLSVSPVYVSEAKGVQQSDNLDGFETLSENHVVLETSSNSDLVNQSDDQNKSEKNFSQENDESTGSSFTVPGMPSENEASIGMVTIAIIAVFSIVLGGVGMATFVTLYKKING